MMRIRLQQGLAERSFLSTPGTSFFLAAQEDHQNVLALSNSPLDAEALRDRASKTLEPKYGFPFQASSAISPNQAIFEEPY